MAKKQKDTRIQFNLSDFYVEKLKIEDGKLFFGTNTRLEEVCKLLELEPKKIARKLKLDKNENPVIDDDQVAEIAMIKGIEFEKVQDISEENVMSQIDSLVLTKE
ncbi:MAG: hypothetical protein DRP42_02090 [Tenericutes bacterium]|nr:MAG: hypothetical protein DRP42_02090 [Mycoplasmatota bacterium]